MDKKKADPKAVKEVAGDPAFYNDQIDDSLEPIKASMATKKDDRPKHSSR